MGRTETRQTVLGAAFGLFSERGFVAATTKEIAQRAGVSEMTLFRHFPSNVPLQRFWIGRRCGLMR